MKISQLLHHREALRRQLQLANLAYAHRQLATLAARITQARLQGLVRLQPAEPAVEHPWPVLTALEGRQSVIDEHFTDENVAELADLLSFIRGEDPVDATFRLEDLGVQFAAPLRQQLEEAGVEFEPDTPQVAASGRPRPNRP
jgi:hypothetical protein